MVTTMRQSNSREQTTDSDREQTLGQRVRKFREAQGYSLTDLARFSRVSRSYLYQVESGSSSPTEDKIKALAVALGVSVADLVGEKVEEPDLPPGLPEYAKRDNLPPEEVRMLARINHRGKRPTTPEGWALLHSVIKAVLRPEE